MSISTPLSDTTIRSIKPGDTRKRLSDGDGLYLLTFVKGCKHGWRLDYTFAARRKTISLGTYPATSLKLAREKAARAREQVAAGIDPSAARKAAKSAAEEARQTEELVAAGLPVPGTFENVAREWFGIRAPEWAPKYAEKVMRRLECDVFPYIGTRPVGQVTAPELLTVLRHIESRGVVETAHRAHETCSQVFRYAVGAGLAASDPARDLKGLLRRPVVKHFAAILCPQRLGELLRSCYGYAGTHIVRTALQLAPMLLLRPGELRHARWEEIDLDTATWTIPGERMKRQQQGKLHGPPHIVPLPRQAVQVLRTLKPLTGRGELVFRGERHHDRPMSENTVNAALRAMGFGADEVVGHGFRATARTLLAERLGVASEVIEAQLAHSVKDSLGRAYNRTEFLSQRRQMMQVWADYLDTLRQGDVPVHKVRMAA
ncbi:MAG TPA: integrase arm-type DNA-binding domain-containing protein [Alicycliphilus sp.]|nr:integrase arm-type DNA-binding domain-containing protein [Alicycliphilus sp.]HRP20071.1 integrase arm-type DNA-binding domain-containing protein [Alicycliphilus sp.]